MTRRRAKSITAVFACTFGVLACAGTPEPVSLDGLGASALAARRLSGGWTLVWQDEFSGASIDRGRWTHEVRPGGNDELQDYTARPENSFVDSGKLHIVAREKPSTGPGDTRRYTSARLNTKGKASWSYGRFEVRAKLPEGQGLWPTIWMMPTEPRYGTWAASGEIDIAELRGRAPGRVHGTLHYGGTWPDNTYQGASFELADGRKFSEGFHVFTLIWERGAVHWFVDGEHYQSQTSWWSAGQDFPAPFDRDFYLLLNVAVGGDWPGNPDETTEFPQQMVVDYVRVYQR